MHKPTVDLSMNKQCNSKFDGITILSNYVLKLLQSDALTSILIHFMKLLSCSCPYNSHFIPIVINFMQNVQL